MKTVSRNKRNTTCFLGLFCILSGSSIANAGTSNISQMGSAYQWPGLYLGGYIGGAWGKSHFATNAGTRIPNRSYFTSTANIVSVNNNGSQSASPNAFIGGINGGSNWVLNSILFGLVLDFSSFHLNGIYNANNVLYPTFPANYSLQTAIKTDWLFTARGRIGLISNESWPMFYATGGLAVTDLQISNSFSDNAGTVGLGGATSNHTKTGWTAGAGAELPLFNHFTLGVEYLYVDFGRVSTFGQVVNNGPFSARFPVASPLNTSANLKENLLKVVVNYKF